MWLYEPDKGLQGWLADPHSQNMCTCSVLLCIAHKSHPLLVQLSQVTSRPRETDSSDYGLTDGAYIHTCIQCEIGWLTSIYKHTHNMHLIIHVHFMLSQGYMYMYMYNCIYLKIFSHIVGWYICRVQVVFVNQTRVSLIPACVIWSMILPWHCAACTCTHVHVCIHVQGIWIFT